MILPAQEIRRLCGYAPGIYGPLIDPFHERNVYKGMSYGLGCASYDVRIAQTVDLQPGDFKLAYTVEKFCIPNDICAICHDKSSWARRGIAVQNTLFDPGWHGYATLELTNHSKERVVIEAGLPIAQIVFHMLSHPTEQPYRGKYQDQGPEVVEARLEQ